MTSHPNALPHAFIRDTLDRIVHDVGYAELATIIAYRMLGHADAADLAAKTDRQQALRTVSANLLHVAGALKSLDL